MHGVDTVICIEKFVLSRGHSTSKSDTIHKSDSDNEKWVCIASNAYDTHNDEWSTRESKACDSDKFYSDLLPDFTSSCLQEYSRYANNREQYIAPSFFDGIEES